MDIQYCLFDQVVGVLIEPSNVDRFDLVFEFDLLKILGKQLPIHVGCGIRASQIHQPVMPDLV